MSSFVIGSTGSEVDDVEAVFWLLGRQQGVFPYTL
jgi:hypothetical protein